MLGLYISDREVDALLDGLYATSASPDADALDQAPIATISRLLEEADQRHVTRTAASLRAGVPLRLPILARRLNLEPFEQNVLLLALAPELNRSYERLFGYLNDDITRRWPSVDLACGLFCQELSQRVEHRRAFTPQAPLQALRLLHLSQEPAPVPPTLLTRLFKLDERIVAYLLGSDTPDPVLDGLFSTHAGAQPPQLPILDGSSQDRAISLCDYLTHHAGAAAIISITGPDHVQQVSVACYLARQANPGAGVMLLDGAALGDHADPEDVVARALREARLAGAALAVSTANRLAAAGGRVASALRRFLTVQGDLPCFLLAEEPWALSSLPDGAPVLHLALPAPDAGARRRLWAASLNGHAPDVNLDELADRFRLTSGQITSAARQAYTLSSLRQPGNGHQVQREDLFASCRAQTATALDGLAQRIESIYTWDDLVLPPQVKQQLRSLEHWVRYRHVVYGEWGYGQRACWARAGRVVQRPLRHRQDHGRRHHGSQPGAGSLPHRPVRGGQQVHRRDREEPGPGLRRRPRQPTPSCSSTRPTPCSASAPRSRTRTIAMPTSRSATCCSAWKPMMASPSWPPTSARISIRLLPAACKSPSSSRSPRPVTGSASGASCCRPVFPRPLTSDLSYLASQFDLAGGSIKNSVLTAAFAAAAEGSSVAMCHLVRAVSLELSKMDQPVVRTDFGPYYELL